MPNLDFYSDRESGPTPATNDELTEPIRQALLSYVISLVNGYWFAEKYPVHCTDGNNVCDTNRLHIETEILAFIPGIRMPLTNHDAVTDTDLFDLLDYTAASISKPKQREYHSYLKHYELEFDRPAGLREVRDRINTILARGGMNYEMDTTGRIQRRGSAPLRHVLAALVPATGDTDLDDLITHATELYTSRNARERQVALEKLWDAFERLKTLKGTGDKKAKIANLLAAVEPVELREEINTEMNALTRIGNNFRIRHAELGKTPVPDNARDYIFQRMGNLLIFLLQANGLLNTGDS